MDVDSIRAYCLSFPDATEKLQWGDALCFKVRAKMFAVLGLDRVRLTLKCTAESFAELIERAGIRPAPYLGHRNWVMLDGWTRCREKSCAGRSGSRMRWLRRRLRGRAAGRKRGRRSLLDREAARGRIS
jgi:hypothetical protein